MKRKEINVQERREKVAKLYREGRTYREIAEELGVQITTITNDVSYLIRNGVVEKRERKIIAKKSEGLLERREKVAKLYREGKSSREIAEELGVSIATVKQDIKVLKEEGIIGKRVSERNSKIAERRKKVAKLYKEGKTYKEMAQELGVTITIVTNDIRWLLEEKVKARTAKKNARELGERSEEEQAYYKKMLEEIKRDLSLGNFDAVLEQIKILESEVGLSEKERNYFTQIIMIIATKLYEDGISIEEISNKLKIDTSTVEGYIESINEMLKGKRRIEVAQKDKEEEER